MKKKLLIVAAFSAALYVDPPTVSVSAAEFEGDVQEQSVQNDIGVAPCADEIVNKFRAYNGMLRFRRRRTTSGCCVAAPWSTLN